MSEQTQGNGSVTEQNGPPSRALEGGGTAGQPEAFGRTVEPPPPAPPKPPFYKRPKVLIIGGLIICAIVAAGVIYYLLTRDWEETDDAFIAADVTQVSPRVAGYVQDVYVTDNQLVTAGQKLVDLDPADYQAQVEEAKASVVAAQKGVLQAQDMITSAQADVGQAQAAEEAAKTEAARAHNELNRYESLSAQAVTQQQLINLRAAANSADAQLNAAKQKTASAEAHVKSAQSQVAVDEAQVKAAQATLARIALNRSYTTIVAPITGYVTNKSVQLGNYVAVNQTLMELVPKDVYVIANFKETQLTDMRAGQSVKFTIDAFPGHDFWGTVDSIQRGSGAAFSLLPPENATGNYVKVVQRVPVKIDYDNQGYRLGPGMSVVPKVKVR